MELISELLKPVRLRSKPLTLRSLISSATRSRSQDAQVAERLTSRRNAFTWSVVHSSHRMTGTSVIPSFFAAFKRRSPSTTSPSVRARTGILNPNSRIEPIMRSTERSFLRRLRAYGRNLPMSKVTTCIEYLLFWEGSPREEPGRCLGKRCRPLPRWSECQSAGLGPRVSAALRVSPNDNPSRRSSPQ